MTSFTRELAIYVGRARAFSARDWLIYVAWIGTIFGLFASTGGFLLFGHVNGVSYPPEAWLIPIGALTFTIAIAIDTIGHRTIYREALAEGEALVHQITIALGVASVLALVLAYEHRIWMVPAMVFTVLSFVYSMIDEVFHWRRYINDRADRVEMWSHVLILVGHSIMMVAWWSFYFQGYPGVRETVEAMP